MTVDRLTSGCAMLVMAAATTPVSAASVSFGAGTAPGGVTLSISGQSVTMTTTQISLGTGQFGSNHLQTGAGTSLGGVFDGAYFDQANHAGGAAADATRLNVSNAQSVLNGEATDFANAVGFRVTFSKAVKLDHFYFVDIDGSNAYVGEWVTSFALHGSQLITPELTTASPTNVLLLEDEAIAASWGTDLGITPPSTLDVARTTRGTYANSGNGGALPGEPDHQALADYDGQSATTLYVFMGGASAAGTGGQNSGVSAFQFDDSELGITPVPLPATAWLMIAGLSGLGVRRMARG